MALFDDSVLFSGGSVRTHWVKGSSELSVGFVQNRSLFVSLSVLYSCFGP